MGVGQVHLHVGFLEGVCSINQRRGVLLLTGLLDNFM